MNKNPRIAWALAAALSCSSLAGAALYGCSDDTNASPTDAGVDTTTPQPDSGSADSSPDTGPDAAAATAKATIRPTFDGGTVNGTATFVEGAAGVSVTVTITGGLPAGPHGMHIHQNGSCGPTTNDAGQVTNGGAAGPHWNPNDAGHGFPDSGAHHLGDMGNITIDDAGNGTLTMTSSEWRVAGDGGTVVVGHAIVFHEGTDDGVSQPVGDAGGRPGCGVIERSP